MSSSAGILNLYAYDVITMRSCLDTFEACDRVDHDVLMFNLVEHKTPLYFTLVLIHNK